MNILEYRCDATGEAEESRFSIRMTVALRAERARIFYALTLAEYIELWAAEPGAMRVVSATEPRENGRYRLRIASGTDAIASIVGRVQVYRPFDQLVFAWKHRVRGRSGCTQVSIDLSPRKARVAMRIVQTEIMSEEEQAYFLAMWTRCVAWLSDSFVKPVRQDRAAG
jgi:uncharacterized protein YndB with AHSA1/START domain